MKRITFLLLALSTLSFSATRRIEVDVLTSNSSSDGVTGLNEVQTANLDTGTVAHVLGELVVGDTADFFRQWNGSQWVPLFDDGGTQYFDYPTNRPLVLVAYGEANTIGVDGTNLDIDESEGGADELNPRVWAVSRGDESVRVGSPVNLFAQSINPTPGAAITRYQATAKGTLMTARQPLPWTRVPFEASVSFVFPLAKMIQEREGRDVIIVPCAVGSAGYSNGSWNVGDPVFEDLIRKTNAAIEDYDAELYAIVGQQGEWDNSNDDFINNKRGTILAFRSLLKGGTNTPIVLGGLRNNFASVNAKLETIADGFSNFVLLDLSDLESDSALTRGNNQWSITAHRTVLPQRYLNGIITAKTDVGNGIYTEPLSDVPTPPTQIELVQNVFQPGEVELYLPLANSLDDSSENNFTVTAIGGLTAGEDYTSFSRAAGHAIDLPEVPGLDGDYTKMVWFRIGDIGATQHLLSTDQEEPSASIFAAANTFIASDRGQLSGNGAPIISRGQWTHLTVSYNSTSSEMSWYINGYFLGTSSNVDPLSAVTERIVRVGNSASLTRGIDGDMKDVIFLDSEITQAELNEYLRISRP